MTVQPDSAPRHGRVAWLPALVAPVVVVALAVGLVAWVADGGTRHDESTRAAASVGLAAPPLDLATVPSEIAGHYGFAREHGEAYAEIPCYCGCEGFLHHRNLHDCFVRSDGKGWDAHAAGCGVCIGESTTARRLLEEGLDPAAVRDAVIAQFGSTPATAPPRA